MSNELTNWFDGFAKVAEASGITDPAELHKLISFHKRAELAAKHPEQFNEGFDEQTKLAQFESGQYQTPTGFTAEDVTPDPMHHAVNYGLGAGALGGLAGGALGKMTGTGRTLLPALPGGMSAGKTFRSLLGQMIKNPSGMRWGLLAGLIGGMYGLGKGKFMSGRYGQGSNVGTTPESYMERMEPEIGRMKAIRERLSGAFGSGRGAPMSPHAWYTSTQPQ